MELRWRSPVTPVLGLLLGLLMAWAFVAAAASTPKGDTTLNLEVPSFLTFPDNGSADPLSAQEASPAAEVVGEQAADSGEAIPLQRSTALQVTLEFASDLHGAGLRVSASGERLLASSAGIGTARQLVLAQAAADRFGITNPFFDPSRAAVIRDGKALVDLSTGVLLGHQIGSGMFGATETIDADLLEQLRNTAGWTITSAREAEAALYRKAFGYVPAYLQSDEAFAMYKESARLNYVALAAEG
jgi:hypothetical protein